MRKRWIIGSSLLAGVLSLLWVTGGFTTERIRQRVTVEIETPAGLRTGSSVTEVTSTHQKLVSSSRASARGEAVYVDLGGGRHVIALLAGGPKGGYVDWPYYLHRLVAGGVVGTNEQTMALAMKRKGQAVDLPPAELPTLVTFADLSDPATVRVVPPTEEGFAAAFGAGHALRRMTVEMVSPGVWPFSLIPAPWPQWLFGTPITREIEKRLPLLVAHREKLWSQRTAPSDPYTPQWGHFIRDF